MNEEHMKEYLPAYARMTPEQIEEINRETRERGLEAIQAAEAEIFQQSMIGSGCPLRLLEKPPLHDGRFEQWSSNLKHIKSIMASAKGVLVGLCGIRGNGKSMIGVEAIKPFVARREQCLFTSAIGLLMRFKECYQLREQTERELMRELVRRLSLVVIDEIGKRSENDWENRLLYELINQRYASLKHTIVISNHNTADFKDALGSSISSRMIESGGIIECDWPSFRG